MAKARGGERGASTRKPLVWLHGEVKTPPFTAEGRQEAGMLLRLLQEGERLGMRQAEALPVIGPRCGALRIRDAEHNWRIMYRIDPDAVVIADVCPKRTRRIPNEVIRRCKQRFAQYDAAVEEAKKKDNEKKANKQRKEKSGD